MRIQTVGGCSKHDHVYTARKEALERQSPTGSAGSDWAFQTSVAQPRWTSLHDDFDLYFLQLSFPIRPALILCRISCFMAPISLRLIPDVRVVHESSVPVPCERLAYACLMLLNMNAQPARHKHGSWDT